MCALLVEGAHGDQHRVCPHRAAQRLAQQLRCLLQGKVRCTLTEVKMIRAFQIAVLQLVHPGDTGRPVHAVLSPEPLLVGLPHVGQHTFPPRVGHGESPALPQGLLGVVYQGVLRKPGAGEYAEQAGGLIGNKGTLSLGGVEQGEHTNGLFQLFFISRLGKPFAQANIAGWTVHIDIFASVLADKGHHAQLVTGLGQLGDVDVQHHRAEHSLPVSQIIQHYVGVIPVLRVGSKHPNINIPLDIVHGSLPCPCRRGISGQKPFLPFHSLRRREPAGLGQIEHGGEGTAGQLSANHSGDQARRPDLTAQLFQLFKILRRLPAVFLHQSLVVENAVHAVIDRQEVDSTVDGHLVQYRSGKVIDQVIPGQIHQILLRQILIQNLGSNKDIRCLAGLHLDPAVVGAVGASVGIAF